MGGAAGRPSLRFMQPTKFERSTMRWPIRRQLFLPLVSLVVGTLALSSVVHALFIAQWTVDRQRESLERLVTTLSGAGFPLHEAVLQKMSGLSGAEFAVLSPGGALQASTIDCRSSDFALLPWTPPVRRGDGEPGSTPPAVRLDAGVQLVLDGKRFLAQRVPVVSVGATAEVVSLVVLWPEDQWWYESRRVMTPPLAVAVVAGAAAALLSAALAQRWVRPIEQLRTQAARIASGDFRPANVPPRSDELGELFQALDQMAAQLARFEDQVRSQERLRTLGQLGGGIAHQLRNSVAGALLALELHEQDCPLQPGCESLEVVHRQLDLMKTYLQRFLALGRGGATDKHPLDLAQLVEETLPLIRPLGEHTRVDLYYQAPPAPLWVMADADALRQLLVNLLLNAVEAAGQAAARLPPPRPTIGASAPGSDREDPNDPRSQPSGRTAQVRIELAPAEEGWLALRIIDSGSGPAAEVRDRLFEPFVSEKPDGAGLGLAVTRQIVQDHGGRIQWRRAAGLTCFTVELPRAEAESDHGALAGRG